MLSNDEKIKRTLPTGFYVLGYECLYDISNKKYEEKNPDDFEDGDNPYEDASVFLHVSCQLFALALQRKYGYSARNLQNEKNTYAHYFCKSSYQGKEVYIDVRGITTDLNKVISEFVLGEGYRIVPYDFVDERVLSKADSHGLEFAEQIINGYPYFYDVNQLGEYGIRKN